MINLANQTNSDEQLMSRVLGSEAALQQQALTLLVERYHAPLLGYLFRLTNGQQALAEDLVQETFLRLLGAARHYQPGRPVRPWLYAIATNLARDHFKSAATRLNQPAPSQDAPEAGPLQVADAAAGPEELAVTKEQGRQIAEAFNQLGEEYRTTLILRFYNGLSLQEIATALQVPLGTVKSRLSVGTRRLRELLAPIQSL